MIDDILEKIRGREFDKADVDELVSAVRARQRDVNATGSQESDGAKLARLGTNAAKWAEEFDRAWHLGSRIDLVGWFANAIEAGRSAGAAERKPSGARVDSSEVALLTKEMLEQYECVRACIFAEPLSRAARDDRHALFETIAATILDRRS